MSDSTSAFFGPLITAMVTPFKENLEVDYDAAVRIAKKLIDDGNDGLVLAGTTGESPTLTHDEKVKLYKTIKDAVGNRTKLIVGTGTYSTAESIKLTQEAESLGMDGALVVSPYYSKPPQEGLYLHFKMIAEKTKLPIMIYNIPGRTGVNISPETLERLAEIPNIIGVKESAGSVEQAAEIYRRTSRVPAGAGKGTGSTSHGFAIWSGDDSLTLPFLSVGACGVVSVAAHLVAPQIKSMIKSYFDGRFQEARKIHLDLLKLYKALFITSNPIQIKAALRLAGFPVGDLRPPLVKANEKEIAALREAMQPLGLIRS